MIRSRTKGLFNAYMVVLSAALMISFWVCLVVVNEALDLGITYPRYFTYSLIALFGLLIHLFRIDFTTTRLLSDDPIQAVRHSLRQVAFVVGAILFMLIITKDRGISRPFLVTYIPILWCIFFVINLVVPRWLCQFFFSGPHRTRTILVGPVDKIQLIDRWLDAVQGYGVEILGILTDDPEASLEGTSVPILGTPNDIEATIRSHSVHSVLLLEIPDERVVLRTIIDACERTGARMVAVNSLSDAFRHSLRYFHHFGLDFVSLREEPLEDPMSRTVKRAFDIVVSFPVVVILLPILSAYVWLVQRIESPGPLFYRQLRTGLRNEPFEIMKFRTMHPKNEDPSRQATAKDPRIFASARFLRSTSLDEFPQFLNVLRGEMSIVGPRPHMLEHDERFAAVFRSYHVRSLIKPGLTGLAQIRGYRGEAKTPDDIRRRVECDIEYIEGWSLVLDIFIVTKTAIQVIWPPKSAY